MIKATTLRGCCGIRWSASSEICRHNEGTRATVSRESLLLSNIIKEVAATPYYTADRKVLIIDGPLVSHSKNLHKI